MCILHVYQFLCWKRRKRCLYIWPRTFTHITSLYGPWNHLDCSSCHKLEMSGHFFFTLSNVFLSCKSLYVKYVLTVLCTNEEKGYLKAVYFKWFPTCEPNIWSLPVLKSVSFSAAVGGYFSIWSVRPAEKRENDLKQQIWVRNTFCSFCSVPVPKLVVCVRGFQCVSQIADETFFSQ